jgi:hypothetical protein
LLTPSSHSRKGRIARGRTHLSYLIGGSQTVQRHQDLRTCCVHCSATPNSCPHEHLFSIFNATYNDDQKSGQKFLTHQFTFLDPPIFLARKLILPTTSFKPAFWTHQCFRPSLEPPIRGKAKKLAVKFLGRAHRSFPNL